MITAQGSLPGSRARSVQRWLEDPDDEVRLLAYGVSTAAEARIARAIQKANNELNGAAADSSQKRLHARLAELHWQLVDRDLIQPDMRLHVVAQVERHARAALGDTEGPASVWYLLGQCALVRHEPDEAQEYFRRAQHSRFPAGLLLPKMARAAFLKRDFKRVTETLEPLRGGIWPVSDTPALNYWKKK